MYMTRRASVVTGGWGPERNENLVGARTVLKCLQANNWNASILDVRSPVDLNILSTEEFRSNSLAFLCHTEELPTIQILDAGGVRHSGGAAWTSVSASYDKALTYSIAKAADVPVPSGRVTMHSKDQLPVLNLNWPVVVKPNRCGSSIGVSYVSSSTNLEEAVAYAFSYDSAVVIEEYLPGNEYTVAAFGGEIFSILKVDSAPAKICDEDSKRCLRTNYSPVKPSVAVDYETLQKYTRSLAAEFGIFGFWRADYRVGRSQVRLLDLNLLPFLGRTPRGLVDSLIQDRGISYYKFLLMVAGDER